MEGNILVRVWKSVIREDKKESLIARGIIILTLSIIFYLTFVESDIILAARNVIVLLTLIWIVLKVEELRNRR